MAFPAHRILAAALIEGTSVRLAGYGTLQPLFCSAEIDFANGFVQGPRLEVEVVDDPGASDLSALCSRAGWAEEDARAEAESWLSALKKGESIEVGELGTIQASGPRTLNFTGNTRGLAEAYWSEKSVPLKVLPRQQPQRQAPEAPVVEAPEILIATPQVAPATQESGRRWLLPAGIAATALALVLLMALWRQSETKSTEEAQPVAVRQDRLNRSPTELGSPSISAGDIEEEEDDAAFPPALPPSSEVPPAGAEVERLPYVIVVGSFTNQAYADELRERVTNAGYEAAVESSGSFTRVGVVFEAASGDEIQAMLSRLRKEFSDGAWLVEDE